MKKVIFFSLGLSLVVFACKNEPEVPACDTLTATVQKTNETCSTLNGSIVISASGGGNTYQYSIDNGASFQASNTFENLAANLYYIIVKDDNDCIFSLTDTLNNEVGTLSLSLATTDAGCASMNGEIVATATGGAGNFTYSIDGFNYDLSNKFTDLAQNSYTVFAKDENEITHAILESIGKKEIPLESYAISLKIDEVFSRSEFKEGSFFSKQTLQNWSDIVKQNYVFAPHRMIQMLYNKTPEIMNKLAKAPIQMSDLKIDKV